MTMLDQNFKKRGKTIVFLTLLAIFGAGCLFFANTSEGRIKPYYSGEAVDYKGEVYVGTVNTGSFELFRWQPDGLDKKTNIISTYHKHPHFNDLKFKKDDGKLYVYLIDGRYLYKYDIKISDSLIPLNHHDKHRLVNPSSFFHLFVKFSCYYYIIYYTLKK